MPVLRSDAPPEDAAIAGGCGVTCRSRRDLPERGGGAGIEKEF